MEFDFADADITVKKDNLRESFEKRLTEKLFKVSHDDKTTRVYCLKDSDVLFVITNPSGAKVRLFTVENYYEVKTIKYSDFFKKDIKNLLNYFLTNLL